MRENDGQSEGKVTGETQVDNGSEDRKKDIRSVAHAQTPPRLFDMKKAGKYMGGVSYDVMKGLRARGELPWVRIRGRIYFDRADLDAYIDKMKFVERG